MFLLIFLISPLVSEIPILNIEKTDPVYISSHYLAGEKKPTNPNETFSWPTSNAVLARLAGSHHHSTFNSTKENVIIHCMMDNS